MYKCVSPASELHPHPHFIAGINLMPSPVYSALGTDEIRACQAPSQRSLLCWPSGYSYHYYYYFFCFLFRAAPMAHGGSQARGRIGAAAASLHHSHSNMGSEPHTTAHGNGGSLTHWASPGIEPTTSWFLVGFVSPEPRWELLLIIIKIQSLLSAYWIQAPYKEL